MELLLCPATSRSPPACANGCKSCRFASRSLWVFDVVFVLMDISEGISKEGAEGGNTMRRNNIKLGRAVKYLLQRENGLFSAFPLRREIPSVHATLNGPSIGCGAPGRNSEVFTKHWIISLRAL